MMYQDRLAVALKVDGKVLREFQDTVYIPFGSEYSLFIKNLNSVRCLVTIEIDGQDIADGDQFVVRANDSINIERFLKNGNTTAGNRFKFIERTPGVEQHRGVGVEDGLIRVQFEFERPTPVYVPPVYDTWTSGPIYNGDTGVMYRGIGGSSICSAGISGQLMNSANASLSSVPCSASYDGDSGKLRSKSASLKREVPCSEVKTSGQLDHYKSLIPPVNDAGITVQGSISEQKFFTVSGFPTDGVKHVMVLKLLGETGEVKVTKAITVKTKQKCPNCGHRGHSTAKFCTKCGTGLQVVV
jgi:hypothetical protein